MPPNCDDDNKNIHLTHTHMTILINTMNTKTPDNLPLSPPPMSCSKFIDMELWMFAEMVITAGTGIFFEFRILEST